MSGSAAYQLAALRIFHQWNSSVALVYDAKTLHKKVWSPQAECALF